MSVGGVEDPDNRVPVLGVRVGEAGCVARACVIAELDAVPLHVESAMQLIVAQCYICMFYRVTFRILIASRAELC